MGGRTSSRWNGLKTFFGGTDTPRWQIAICFIATTVISILVTNLTDHQHVVNDARSQQIRALSDSMTQFQVHASAFAADLLDHKASSDAKKALLENLNDQYAHLRTVEPFIPSSKRSELEDYKSALVKMKDVVDTTDSVLTMGPFWTSASNLLRARNRLNEDLQSSL